MILKIIRQDVDDEGNPVLAYNRDRSFEVDLPFEDVQPLFGERDRIVFCHAQVDERGDLQIGRKLAQRPDW